MKREIRRVVSGFLAVFLLSSPLGNGVHAAEAEETVIRIADEGDFLLLADQCRVESFSSGKIFRLERDLDLSEYENLFLPVMNGVFEGNGHTVTGLVLEEEMSDYGLFRYVGTDGVIRNLTVEAEVLGKGDQENIGILAGSNAGRIQDCVSRGSVNAEAAAGGIAGKNEETGTIVRSRNEAQVDAINGTGGIVGYNEGTISDCINIGVVNTNQKVKKEMDGEGTLTVSIPNAAAGFGKDERANQTGGIAGYSSGVIVSCINQGTVGYEHLGYETGGIVGRQNGSVSYCQNEGMVYGRRDVGGIAGYFEPYEAAVYDRNYSQELEGQLDELSKRVDDLKSAGDAMGDHLSGNLDVLSDQLKALKNSVRGYLDHYGDMAESSENAIRDQVDALRSTVNGMQYDFGLEKMDTHRKKIAEDVQQIQEILARLRSLAGSSDAGMAEQLQKIITRYEEQIQELQRILAGLEDYIKNHPAQGEGNEGSGADDSEGTDLENTDSDSESQNTDTSGEESDTGNTDDKKDADDTQNADDKKNTDNTQDVDDTKDADNTGDTDDIKDTKDTDNTGDTDDTKNQEQTDTQQEQKTDGGLQNSAMRSAEPEASGQMTAAAFTAVDVTDSTESAELQAALQRLQVLSADIQTNVGGILSGLEGIPGEAQKLHSDFRSLGNHMDQIASTLDTELSSWSDELGAMKNDLRGQGDGISGSVETASDVLESDWDTVSDRLGRIKEQFDLIRGTVSDGFDELKNRIEDRSVYVDVSDIATAESGAGKVVFCTNSGEIRADSQGGGIAGSIRKEGREDVIGWLFDDSGNQDEEDSGSLTRHVLAAVFYCVNTGGVSVEGDYAGGVVGRAAYGLIASSENYGDVQAPDGTCVGGIAGQSEYAVRDCYVLSGIDGKAGVGGVAGEGEDITGNYVCSYMDMKDYVKSSGAVAGQAGGTVEGNYFVDNGYGAVDGVTRSQEAEAVDYTSLLSLKEMPDNFTQFTIRFMDGEETVWQDTFAYGEEFTEEDYPELPEAEEGYIYWESREISPIHRNVTIHAVRRAYIPSLEAKTGSDGSGLTVLLGGEFYPDTSLTVWEATEEELQKVKESLQGLAGYRIKQVIRYQIDQEEPFRTHADLRVTGNHVLADSILLLDDEYRTVEEVQRAEHVGSFLAVETGIVPGGYVVILNQVDQTAVVLGAAAVVLLAGAGGLMLRRRKRGQEIQEEEESQEEESS